MSTPTDPYSSNSRRPFEDDEILAPLPATSPSSASTPSSGAQVNPPAFVDDSWTDTEIFAHTQGMDPAFDQRSHDEDGTGRADAPDAARPFRSIRSCGTTSRRRRRGGWHRPG